MASSRATIPSTSWILPRATVPQPHHQTTRRSISMAQSGFKTPKNGPHRRPGFPFGFSTCIALGIALCIQHSRPIQHGFETGHASGPV
ncbi:hypothetical protein ASPWEDRAFT_45327 [Aspergillus wentii DTO 134E9]|uniref:Uncharacterized protein n=1 Tax=Aspergillus wentii DTO 134E9 TaxID=1073089 RepID=A0A1L9R951_ASPWE|nr:uncharacterized protein ASPWEDRAFT_45327 [Aspergillus wentii DTO 134E9]OJJ31387.1 hypothetical protein ASPWEDRAFT_45327 [Aspergillus wentii DTO 134E9]